MEKGVGADRARVEVPSHAFSQGTHRVVDPADPPRELSGWAWGVYVSLGLVAILALLRFFAALGLHSAVTGGGDIVGDYHDYSRWVGIDAVVFLVAAGVFITWFFQAYKNLRRLGVRQHALRERVGDRGLVRPHPQPGPAEADRQRHLARQRAGCRGLLAAGSWCRSRAWCTGGGACS